MLPWVLRVLQRHLGGGALGKKLGIARDVAFRLLQIGLGAGELAFDLLHLGFDSAAVEREQQVTLVHQRTVAEMHAGDLAVDAHLDGDAGDRGDRAEHLDAHGNRLLRSGRNLDRNGARRVLARRLGDGAARPQSAPCCRRYARSG